MKDNKTKVILLTGANSKICEDLIPQFFDHFDEIILHCRTKFKAYDKIKSLDKKNKVSYLVKADLCDENQTKEMFEYIISRSNKIDYLVNFCGNYHNCDLLETTLSQWNDMISSNATAAFLLSKYIIPLMKENNYGRIIHFADSIADQYVSHEDIVPYHMAKHGILLLTKTLAKTYACANITVNNISPGVVVDSVNKPHQSEIPMNRYASKQDIFEGIMFLFSKQASYITGQDLKIAGGYKL